MVALLTPGTVEVAATVIKWAREFLATGHPDMRRPGRNQVVCPFVGASLDNNSFYLSIHPEISGKDEEQIESLVLDQIEAFKHLGPFAPCDRTRKALLLVFPGLSDDQARVLDIVHANIKTRVVETV